MPIKIYIDQGHNPVNPNAGAEGNGLREQNITYDIGNRLAALLRANGDFDVRLSRNSPTEQIGTSNSSSLRIRTEEANAWGADYFISLHCNASANSSASGTEAYAYRQGSQGFALAEDIVAGIVSATGLRNRGVFARPSLYVLRFTNMPAVLVEMGFISNPRDASLLSEQPDLFARGIYNGILAFFGM